MNPATVQTATTVPARREPDRRAAAAPVPPGGVVAPARPGVAFLRLVGLIIAIGVTVGLLVAAGFGVAAVLVSGSLG